MFAFPTQQPWEVFGEFQSFFFVPWWWQWWHSIDRGVQVSQLKKVWLARPVTVNDGVRGRIVSVPMYCFCYHWHGRLTSLLRRHCFIGLRSGQVHMPAEDLADPTDEEVDMFECLLLLVSHCTTLQCTALLLLAHWFSLWRDVSCVLESQSPPAHLCLHQLLSNVDVMRCAITMSVFNRWTPTTQIASHFRMRRRGWILLGVVPCPLARARKGQRLRLTIEAASMYMHAASKKYGECLTSPYFWSSWSEYIYIYIIYSRV